MYIYWNNVKVNRYSDTVILLILVMHKVTTTPLVSLTM